MWLIVALLLLPLVEIALFIIVGGWIGLWPTLLLVVLGIFAGALVLRTRAVMAPAEMRAALAAGKDPMAPAAHGALTMLAGLLLMLPGFFTDGLALLLLVPGVRRAILRNVASKVTVHTTTTAGRRGDGPIDADYEIVDDPAPPRRPGPPSGWTRIDG